MQKKIRINDAIVILSVLGAPLEPLFERFYADYFNQRPLPWDDLAVAARDYFDQHAASFDAHNDYFNNFISLWQRMMAAQLYVEGESVWEQALQPALAWEKATGQRLHKGTPYYFWAMTVIMRRDMDRGYLLAHKAFQEDVDSSGQPNPDTPGYALVSLDQDKPDNAFRAWVVYQAQYLEQRLKDYNTTHGKNLTFPDVRQKFLVNPPTTDTLFLFTYTLARLMNITESPDHTRTNAFAGQLEINILFDITLVIEETIKHKNPTKHRPDGRKLTFVHQGDYLLATAGHPLTLVNANGQPVSAPQLSHISSLFEDDSTFDTTLFAAVDGKVTKGANPALDRLQCDVALAYGIRNHAAHNTNTAPTIWNRFDEVQQALFRVLFAAIEHLY